MIADSLFFCRAGGCTVLLGVRGLVELLGGHHVMGGRMGMTATKSIMKPIGKRIICMFFFSAICVFAWLACRPLHVFLLSNRWVNCCLHCHCHALSPHGCALSPHGCALPPHGCAHSSGSSIDNIFCTTFKHNFTTTKRSHADSEKMRVQKASPIPTAGFSFHIFYTQLIEPHTPSQGCA